MHGNFGKVLKYFQKENYDTKFITVDELHIHSKRMFGEQPEPNQNAEPIINMIIFNAELDAQFTYLE